MLLEDIGKLKRFANTIATLRVIADVYKALRLTDGNNPMSRRDLSAHVQTHREPAGQRFRDR